MSKAYWLGESQRGLRHAVGNLGSALVGRRRRSDRTEFWALREVDFEVGRGEALGIVGPNGAGKTTVLRLLSRISTPTVGSISVEGRVSALIELGAGFHPDLTGRENVYLNGAILGLGGREIDAKFDSIVSFSGLEAFIDTPVKRYSSGMYVRLGFAVAAHVEPQILLVDEVLSVGDAEFRQKCADRIASLRSAGTTIVFISHNLYLVQSVCDRGLFLANGNVETLGSPTDAIEAYEAWRRQELKERGRASSDGTAPGVGDVAFAVRGVQVRGSVWEGEGIRCTDALDIDVTYRVSERLESPRLYLKVIRNDGSTACMVRSSDYGYDLPSLTGDGVIWTRIEPVQLTPGLYCVHAEILGSLEGVALAEGFSEVFEIAGSAVGREGVFVPHVSRLEVRAEGL